MKTILKIDAPLYRGVIEHLLPPEPIHEQAAFLFAREDRQPQQATFTVEEAAKLGPRDFEIQQRDYIEMADETRARIIKRAHDTGTCLIEIHSHLGDWPAGFSYADRFGLKETVPHMWWRLKKRPYLALVVTNSSFDALVWLHNARTPQQLDILLAGDETRTPTNFSLRGWG
ncbi:hypothetical protein [Bradyrhizobium japonicum]|uniref:hypothetical protein n=1 Tax=Bradyrhizobium japonicum TaxID=375 RepID=UPI0004B5B851|nr:hypothetical protein [Bradyrhizobium japonicum]